MLAYTTIMLVSLISHGSYVSATGEHWNLFGFMRGYAIPFATYAIARRGVQTDKQLHVFLTALGFFAVYLIFTGLMEILNIRWLVFPRFILDPHSGIHFGQARGIFLNASLYGLALALLLPILIWLFFTDLGGRHYLWPLTAGLALVPLAYTIQRAAWLSAVATLSVLIVAWPRRRIVFTGIMVFAVSAGCVVVSDKLMQRFAWKMGDEGSINYRFIQIETGLAMFKAQPMFGIGFNRFRLERSKYTQSALTLSSAHNTWITLLAELGLVGGLPYVAIFGFALCEAAKHYWQYPRYRAFLGIPVSVTMGFIIMATSIEVRNDLYANTFIFALWGMSLEAVRRGVIQHVPYHRREVSQAMLSNRVDTIQPRENESLVLRRS
jgi:O-antigen ligase